MNPRVPFGFVVCGLCSAGFALVLSLSLVFVDDVTVPGRAAIGLLAAMALVTTEALWGARRWSWRASVALAVCYVAVVVIGCAAEDELDAAFSVLGSSAVVVAPQLAYIHGRARKLWPRPGQLARGVRLPAASPHPPAHVAPSYTRPVQPGHRP